MQANAIRSAFLDFFQQKGHVLMPSSSLIPAGDPTLLLTNAGMVQFKPYFMGEMTPPAQRLTTVQKCFRVTDIDVVGDATHLTFFEMLGNFSVGDYFKEDAIAYAWEFVTQHMKLPPERLWTTVYTDDDEAHALWRKTGVPAGRIRRFGAKDNFWGPAGSEGPCGPCSEVHYDFGGTCRLGKPAAKCGPNCECGRFLELWNLVFMQFYQDAAGKRTPLPKPNIDTGMGLERAALILQGKASIYETDLFVPIVERVCKLAGKEYGKDEETDRAIRVVAEHARSAAFLIADGVMPGNEGRGYVLRRVIRRGVFHAWRHLRVTLNAVSAISQVADAVVQLMGAHYPELINNWRTIRTVLNEEEERFIDGLRKGTQLIGRDIVHLSKALQKHLESDYWQLVLQEPLSGLYYSSELPEPVKTAFLTPIEVAVASLSAPSQVTVEQRRAVVELTRKIPGSLAFLLYDTYGLPLDVTVEVAAEHGLSVDMEGFQREMEAQRQRGRASAAKFGGEFDAARFYQELGLGGTRFLGYETTTAPSVVVGLVVDGASVERATEGQQAEVILRETPFYAEGGGQVGDAGVIEGPHGAVQVEDTQSPVAGLIVHRGKVAKGAIAIGETVVGAVDRERRMDSARNHTATHMLHAALRQVLGTHVRQAGSLVTPDRLRFDFTHVSPLTEEELRKAEAMVNERIRANVPVRKQETTYRQAVSDGALAFFGDKYGDQVRVVEIADTEPQGTPAVRPEPVEGRSPAHGSTSSPRADGTRRFSFEVCGGTHVSATGDLGLCLVMGESSIGAGMRRIEAVTGRAAEAYVREREALIGRVSRRLEAAPQNLEARVDALTQEVERLRRESAVRERASSAQQAGEVLERVREVSGVKVAAGTVQATSTEALREVGDRIRDKLGSGVVALGAVVKERPTLLVMVTKDLVERGLHAGNAVKEAAAVMGGGGGGRPDMAQAGGREADKLDAALKKAVEVLARQAAGG